MLLLIVTGAMLGGCGQGGDGSAADRAYAVDQLSARFAGRSQMRTYETLDEVLPNVVYRRPDGRGAALSSSATTLELRDDHGSLFIVPTAGIAYVQIGSEESRRVGFVA